MRVATCLHLVLILKPPMCKYNISGMRPMSISFYRRHSQIIVWSHSTLLMLAMAILPV